MSMKSGVYGATRAAKEKLEKEKNYRPLGKKSGCGCNAKGCAPVGGAKDGENK